MGITERAGSLKMQIDPETGAGYLQLSGEGVAYSIDIDEAVIADYDNSGEVVGVEFLDAKTSAVEIMRYIELAKVRSKGASAGSQPRIPTASAGS